MGGRDGRKGWEEGMGGRELGELIGFTRVYTRESKHSHKR